MYYVLLYEGIFSDLMLLVSGLPSCDRIWHNAKVDIKSRLKSVGNSIVHK